MLPILHLRYRSTNSCGSINIKNANTYCFCLYFSNIKSFAGLNQARVVKHNDPCSLLFCVFFVCSLLFCVFFVCSLLFCVFFVILCVLCVFFVILCVLGVVVWCIPRPFGVDTE